MDELKHYDIKDIEAIDDERTKDAKPGRLIHCTRVYIKSEVDDAIAEKDERIDELQKATDSAWSKVNTMYDELRHNKYKRCFAVADFCESQHDYYNTLGNGFWLVRGDKETREKYRKKASDFWWKWHKRWHKIAEKFKEVK